MCGIARALCSCMLPLTTNCHIKLQCLKQAQSKQTTFTFATFRVRVWCIFIRDCTTLGDDTHSLPRLVRVMLAVQRMFFQSRVNRVCTQSLLLCNLTSESGSLVDTVYGGQVDHHSIGLSAFHVFPPSLLDPSSRLTFWTQATRPRRFAQNGGQHVGCTSCPTHRKYKCQ